MERTDTRDPDYYHRVVDCQWACPAHTNVPEYIQTDFTAKSCIECDACIDICPTHCLTMTKNADEPVLRQKLSAPALNLKQPLYVSDALPQTKRVMMHIALFPNDPGECFTMARDSFDLAERYQTPVFVVSDLDIAMNDWMIPKLAWDDGYVPDRGKVLSARQLEELEAFYRYLDVDGDEIPYRTLPGMHPKGAYFTRGSGHEGTLSTLCAGCGHDSITAAIIRAFWRLAIEPHRVVKLSGIGCSSKTPTYFLSDAHGFNSVHGRMPSVATGANAANRELTYIGISGDGDSLSIGLGQLCNAIRRNVDLTYVLENNGIYALTKGQFSASADVGTRARRGAVNEANPIDPALLALTLGATFIARSFSGDKEQLVPILEAALRHRGFALIDVISPCVTFNNHVGSTKSYVYTREHYHEVTEANLVPLRTPIEADQTRGEATQVRLHDGSLVTLRSVDPGYDPTDRDAAYMHLRKLQDAGEVATGLLYVETGHGDMHSMSGSIESALVDVPFEELCPGGEALDRLMEEFR